MDDIDKKIAGMVQRDGRLSYAEIATALGMSVSTARERVRKLVAGGAIRAWRGVLDPGEFGAGLLAFLFVDMHFDGEADACEQIVACPEVQEAHHVSGQHSYLLKVRVADTDALQNFLTLKLKPLAAIVRTETIVVLAPIKETTEILIGEPGAERTRA